MATASRTLIEALQAAAATPRGFRHLQPDGSVREQPYASLLDEARAVAAALQDRDIPRGSIAALIIPDSASFLSVFMGTVAAGLVPAPLHTPAATAEPRVYLRTLLPTLTISRARAIIVEDALAPALNFPDPSHVIPLSSIVGGSSRVDPAVAALDDPAFVQFTSGSTAEPRGVLLTHRAIAANISAIGGPSGLAFGSEDRGLSWLPLHHDMGLVGMALAALYFDRPATFLPALTFLKRPIEWLRAIAREQATVSFAPAFAFDLCVRRIADEDVSTLDLSSWRVAGCGGEPIRAGTLEAFARKLEPAGFTPSALAPSYGLAEHTLAVTLSRPGTGLKADVVRGDVLSSRGLALPCEVSAKDAMTVVSCGRSIEGHHIRIVDESGVLLPDRSAGDIEIAGPSLMREYLGNPEATAHTLNGRWLKTGDCGYLVNGELYVCGRRKETIILHGRNYYPQDIEWVLSDLPGLRAGKVAAFGIGHGDDQGERLVIMIEAPAFRSEALIAAVRCRVRDAFGLTVDDVPIVPAGTIGLTTSGKLQRARARAFYESPAPP
jgi:fatty-acyl-CoA synthase